MFLALALSAAFVPPAQAANELASLHWGHPQANPHRSSSVALPGVTARPRELWRHEFDAVLSPLVARGGVVFAVVRDGRREELVAFDAATGASLDEVDPRARDAEDFWIAVDAEHIAVVGADGAHLFSFDREDGFKRVASTREAMQADALLLPHALVVRRPDGRLQMLDRDKLEPHGDIDLGASQPSWYDGHLVAIAPSSSGRQLTLDRVACRRDGEAWILDEHAEPLGRVLDGELDRRDGEVRAPGPIKLPRSRNPIGPYRPAWFLPTLGGVKSEEGEIFPGLVWPSAGGLAPLHHVPAATGSFLLGLNEAGDLIELQDRKSVV